MYGVHSTVHVRPALYDMIQINTSTAIFEKGCRDDVNDKMDEICLIHTEVSCSVLCDQDCDLEDFGHHSLVTAALSSA